MSRHRRIIFRKGDSAAPRLDGGAASTEISEGITATVEPAENTAGVSAQNVSRETTRTIHHLDGSIEVIRKMDKVDTTIASSQDATAWLGAAAEYAKPDHLAPILFGLVLLGLAWMRRKEWPIVASCLAIGGAVTLYTLSLIAGVLTCAIAGALYVGWRSANPIP